VTGEIDPDDGTLRVVRIRVRYSLRIPAGMRDDAERALEHHVSKCPVARTLSPCVEIAWEADIQEESPAEELFRPPTP